MVCVLLQNFPNWPCLDISARSGTCSFRVDAITAFSHGIVDGHRCWWQTAWRCDWRCSDIDVEVCVYVLIICMWSTLTQRATPQSSNRVLTSLGNSGLYWTVFARNRDTAVSAEGNGDLQTLICVLVARPRRCNTLSNPVPWKNWMVAYLGYTLLFRGWPIMVHDMHTRRRICVLHVFVILY